MMPDQVQYYFQLAQQTQQALQQPSTTQPQQQQIQIQSMIVWVDRARKKFHIAGHRVHKLQKKCIPEYNLEEYWQMTISFTWTRL